jgi:hypothetical protein
MSPKMFLDLISVVDWYESFLKYLIAEKNTHHTRTSLRSGTSPKSIQGWAWLSPVPGPRILEYPTLVLYPYTKKLRKKHCHQHIEIESQISQFQRTDGSHEIPK